MPPPYGGMYGVYYFPPGANPAGGRMRGGRAVMGRGPPGPMYFAGAPGMGPGMPPPQMPPPQPSGLQVGIGCMWWGVARG
eukprot:149880-Chlamydomonas_euryale.AAC.1